MATVGKDASYNKSTGKYVRQGDTQGPYGRDSSKPGVNRNPREVKP